jgi:hypothetical protein
VVGSPHGKREDVKCGPQKVTPRTSSTTTSKFDRNAYQKDYMREIYRPAKKLGITPEEYRARKSKGENK